MVKYKYIWSADKQNRIFVAITLDMSDKTLLHIKIAVIIKFSYFQFLKAFQAFH